MAVQPFWQDWPALERRISEAGRLLLFLDYDGTLTPIVDQPSKADLSAPMEGILRKLSRQKGTWVAVVSGRGLKDLRRKMGIPGLCYVGNHGLEVHGKKLRHINPTAQKSRPLLRKIRQQLKKALKPIRGAWVEDKQLTLSVHFRSVPEDQKILVRNAFHEVVGPYQLERQIRITSGKEVFEVRPPVRWHKGNMVLWLLACQAALVSGADPLPVYVGDDQTDEDAFESLGSRGISIVVGPGNSLTRAQYLLHSQAEVEQLLRKIWEVRRIPAVNPTRPRARFGAQRSSR